MRVQDTSGSLRLNAIAGTSVVLGFDMDQADCRGLLGFSVNRTSHDEDESGYLTGMKASQRRIRALRAARNIRRISTQYKASIAPITRPTHQGVRRQGGLRKSPHE